MDRETWWPTVHVVAKSRAQLSDKYFHKSGSRAKQRKKGKEKAR